MTYFLPFFILLFLLFLVPLLRAFVNQRYEDDFYESDEESLALLSHLVQVNSEWIDKRS